MLGNSQSNVSPDANEFEPRTDPRQGAIISLCMLLVDCLNVGQFFKILDFQDDLVAGDPNALETCSGVLIVFKLNSHL